MNTYDISSIIYIGNDGLKYIDEHGNEKFIDFRECRNSWVKHMNESENYVDCNGEPVRNVSENDTTCVAHRNWLAEKPYYEFFTSPRIRFEITLKKKIFDALNKNWKGRYYKIFCNIRFSIDNSGWSTFDLS
jgi:hypothetical protein